MLEAADIILITIGCFLLLLITIVAACAAKYYQRKNKEEEALEKEKRKKMTLEYYVEQPVKFAIDKSSNWETMRKSNASYFNEALVAAIDETIHPEPTVDQDISESTILDYSSPGNCSPKKLKRPDVLKIEKSEVTAWQAEAIYTKHLLSEFPAVMKKIMASGAMVIQEEFKLLERRSRNRQTTCSTGERHKTKNRFSDVLPYDQTRVVLQNDSYINANFIDGHHTSHQFIATQGPIGTEENCIGKENTIDDFWQMVWEKNVSCIIMLSDCGKNIKPSCSQYWPSDADTTQYYGRIGVTLLNNCTEDGWEERSFKLVFDGTPRQVTQYHYHGWEDCGATLPEQLLYFTKTIMGKTYVKPILIHCSAGIGRTGVIISLWRVLVQAREEGVIDIFSVVDDIRSQRTRMVQTFEQYANIYDATLLAVCNDQL